MLLGIGMGHLLQMPRMDEYTVPTYTWHRKYVCKYNNNKHIFRALCVGVV